MRMTLLLALILMTIVAVFSVQNAGMITVRFLTWRFEWSQALVILLAAFAGAIVGLLAGVFAGRRTTAKLPDPPPKP